ncbi:MAG: fused response regulator/phosphatase [Magnetospirillum sp.]|nr:fused response regulator/phosphatase [Magnetospirillum sp.]
MVILDDARVLVVEDNELNRIFACAVLESMGVTQVECAVNGREGLEKLGGFAPDLVLLDLMMPIMDGQEFLRHLRADPRYRDLPVLVVSAVDSQSMRNALFAVGASDYVSKPIDRHELVARVGVHLRNHLLLTDLRRYRDRLAHDLATARGMQNALLPGAAQLAQAQSRFGLSIAAMFRPSAELGGDLWGLEPVDENRLAVFTVDFTGHGVAASINTFRMHLLLTDMAEEMGDPAACLTRINAALVPLLPRGQFATMTLAVIDRQTATLALANAGGPAPILAVEGEVQRLTGRGLPLGISSNPVFANSVVAFPPGSQLSLYSDALVDAADASAGDLIGEDGVLEMVRGALCDDPAGMVDGIMAAFAARSPGEAEDDVTWVQVLG